jgi:hypothetical protein
MSKLDRVDGCAFGLIVPGSTSYDAYRARLGASVTDGYVRLYPAP